MNEYVLSDEEIEMIHKGFQECHEGKCRPWSEVNAELIRKHNKRVALLKVQKKGGACAGKIHRTALIAS